MAIDKDTLLQEASCLICGGVSYADAIIIALLQRIAEGSCGTCPGMLSGEGSPVGAQTPNFIGQLYHDTGADEYWRSTGLTNANWVIISGGAVSGVDLFTYDAGTGTEFSSTLLTELTVPFWINGGGGDALTSVSFPNLVTSSNYFTLEQHPQLTSVNLDSLEVVGDGTFGLQITDNDTLPSISLPSLVTINGDILCQSSDALTSFSAPNLVTVTMGITGSSNAALQDLDFSSFLPTNGTVIGFNLCALTEASVDHILARCVANAAFVTGNVALDGGTNAPPGVQGAADVLTLQGRGVTVTTN